MIDQLTSYWYNNGTDTMEVTNHFFFSLILGPLQEVNMKLDRSWALRKPTTTVLIKEYRIKDSCLHTAVPTDQCLTASPEKLLEVDGH